MNLLKVLTNIWNQLLTSLKTSTSRIKKDERNDNSTSGTTSGTDDSLAELPKGEHHFSEFIQHPKWRWSNFTPQEIACKGTGLLLIDEEAMDKLQLFRERLGVPFRPNSAYRSLVHNRNVGSTDTSMHRLGKAFDIPLGKMTREDVHRVAREVGFTGFGDYNTFVHIDTGRARFWDERT